MEFNNVVVEVTRDKGFIDVLVEDSEKTGAWVCCNSLEKFISVLVETKETGGRILAISTEGGD